MDYKGFRPDVLERILHKARAARDLNQQALFKGGPSDQFNLSREIVEELEKAEELGPKVHLGAVIGLGATALLVGEVLGEHRITRKLGIGR
jgi:hypothetical protein